MRVTKTVREYIEKKVKALFPLEEELPAVVRYNNLSKKRTALVDEAVAEIKALCDQHLARINAQLPDDYNVKDLHPSYNFAWSSDCAARREAEAEKKARTTAIREAIDNIVVELELGGTKDTLDRMLKELAERV